MSQNTKTRRHRLAFMLFATIAVLVASTLPTTGVSLSRASSRTDSLSSPPAPDGTIAVDRLIKPEALAPLLADSTARRPEVLQVGFKVLFRSGHILRSRYIGPASKPEGLAALKKALRGIPRQHPVVLYCGCCPWTDCPNVRPAYRVAREMGFKDVRVLYVAKNLQHDWIDKGLPFGEGDR